MAFQSSEITISLDNLTNVLCPNGKTGSISVSVSGGTGSLSYSWTGPENFASSSQDLSNLAPGTYRLKVTDQTTPTPLSRTAEFTVIQEDLEAPVLNAPAQKTFSADAGKCTNSTVSLGSPQMSDNCSVTSIQNDAPMVFPVGETIVTWTAKDAFGNSTTDTQLIIITDDEKPTITAPADISVSADAGNCSATNVSLGSETANDNCGVQTVSHDAPTSFPLGNTIVTWTVTDDAGNTQNDTQLVTITDDEKPTITAPVDISVSADAGSCSATNVSLGSETANDNCEVQTVSHDAPASFPLGNTTVTWTVIDDAGNTQTDTQLVTVTDDEKPTITAPADISVSADAGSCSATNVSLGSETANDNCGIQTVSHDAPTSFPLGNTTVTWTVTDDAGNTQNDTQLVTVTDDEKPTITAPADIAVSADAGSCNATNVSLGSETANDNCGVQTVSHDAPASFPLGNTTVTWTVTDDAGNTQTDTQLVTVTDDEKPTIAAPADISVSADAGSCNATNISLGSETANDNCGIQTVSHDAPASFPLGNTTVTWTVTDDAGNIKTDTQLVTVTDDEKPTITAPADISVSADAGSCSATNVSLGSETANDNCGVQTVSHDAPASFPLGNTTVTWTVTDDAGNTKTDTQLVTVTDDEAPVITVGADLNVENEPGTCSASVNVPAATTTDNCSVGSPTATRSDGKNLSAKYPVGTTTLTWSVVDDAGNPAAQVKQKVMVTDSEPPKIPVLEDILSGCEVTISAPTTSDNCAGSITGTTTDPLTYSTPGTYTVNWSFDDNNGNVVNVPQEVTIDPVKGEILSVENVLCNGFSTGKVTVSGSGGNAPYTYTWARLGMGATKENLSAGTYSVVISDSQGCESTPLEVVITEPDSFLEITEISFISGCYMESNATATVQVTGGTGNYTYLWSDGQTGQTAEGLSSGNYSVTVTDENGCEAAKEVNITAPEELTIPIISTTQTNSFGTATGTATANVRGGTAPYTFTWSNGATGQIIRNLAAGNYSVTVTDANGCSYSEEFSIVDPLESAILPTSMCLDEEGGIRTSTFETEFVRGGTAPYTYSWTFGEGASLPDGTKGSGVHVVDYTSTGNKVITLTVKDKNGLTYEETFQHYVGECFEACGETQNLDFDLETFYVGKEDQTPLSGSECSTYTGKKYIYLKVAKNSNAYNPNVEFIYTITDLNDGGSVVDVQEITGCIDVGGDGKIPEIFRVGEIPNWSCGYSIRIENFYMSWTNNSKKKCGDVRRMMCVSTNENDEIYFPLYASATSNNLLCYGDTSGVITVTAAGGIGAREFRLSKDGAVVRDWQTEKTFRELGAGTYTATVRDEELDTYTTQELIISEPQNPLTVTKPMVKTSVTCYGGSDGTATVEVSGGTPFSTGEPYIFVWSNSQTTATATGLAAGEHSVTILDANGCEVTEYVTIEQPEQTQANAGTDQTLTCGVTTTKIGKDIPEDETGHWEVVNGPSGWSLEDANSAQTVFKGNIGTYTLRWTESCGSRDDVKITISDCSTIDFDGENDYIEFGDNYKMTGEFSLEAWIKLKSVTGIKTVLSKRDFSNLSNGGYDLVVDNGLPKFRWNGNSVDSPHAIDTSRWYHLAVTSGSDGTILYIDGIEVATGSQATPATAANAFLLGGLFDSSAPFTSANLFHGWIEEVRIWSTELNIEQIRFMMNQKLVSNNGLVRGAIIPINVPGNLSWNNLQGYYHLEKVQNGFAIGETTTSIDGKLRNITTIQEHSAPLPYDTKSNGNWWDTNLSSTPWIYGEGTWDAPYSAGVNNDKIKWNIVRISTDVYTEQNAEVLGLLVADDETLLVEGSVSQTSGNALSVSHYLGLDGTIDLNGESQLVQFEKSIAEGNGHVERDQQGTASSYNYNYWSSPVIKEAGNTTYRVADVLAEGNKNGKTVPVKFGDGPFYVEHNSDPNHILISNYWINGFFPDDREENANKYSAWKQLGSNPTDPAKMLKSGEGFTMKGSMNIAVEDSERQGIFQNYTFKGFPNNGDVYLRTSYPNQNYLTGNPYPSAIDSHLFIDENEPYINGAIYYWHHFAGKSHYLEQYVGGYAVYNKALSLPAKSVDSRIDNSDPNRSGQKVPGRYVPVAQGFFVNTSKSGDVATNPNPQSGQIKFTNEMRLFVSEENKRDSQFLKPESKPEKQASYTEDNRYKILLNLNSPQGYWRQIGVTADVSTSAGFDYGYDAPILDKDKEDMFWIIDGEEYVIQAVPDFNVERVLPIGLVIAEEKEFSIEIDRLENMPDDVQIFIRNNSDSTYHDLRKGRFRDTIAPGYYGDRYDLVFQEPVADVDEGEDENDESDDDENDDDTGDKENGEDDENNTPKGDYLELFFSGEDNEITILNPYLIPIYSGTLYTVSGQKVQDFHQIPSKEVAKLKVQQNPRGVYIISLQLEQGTKSIKLIKE
ncbi:HYR domain-containing protein [Salinimicrobium sp. GXAS 041]|uniref:HYR domain-containing protein n=1 Tax=Salinimicrobium sp. GXAS 041 TaxID=3400806 RepID=UPI003C708854